MITFLMLILIAVLAMVFCYLLVTTANWMVVTLIILAVYCVGTYLILSKVPKMEEEMRDILLNVLTGFVVTAIGFALMSVFFTDIFICSIGATI